MRKAALSGQLLFHRVVSTEDWIPIEFQASKVCMSLWLGSSAIGQKLRATTWTLSGEWVVGLDRVGDSAVAID